MSEQKGEGCGKRLGLGESHVSTEQFFPLGPT
jgi:hypothetical protein